MRHRSVEIAASTPLAGILLFTALAAAPSEPASHARIAILRPNDGDTVDFEAGYVRLRPRASVSAILEGRDQVLPDEVNAKIAKMTVEILNLRPAMSYGLPLDWQ